MVTAPSGGRAAALVFTKLGTRFLVFIPDRITAHNE